MIKVFWKVTKDGDVVDLSLSARFALLVLGNEDIRTLKRKKKKEDSRRLGEMFLVTCVAVRRAKREGRKEWNGGRVQQSKAGPMEFSPSLSV
jgi:hypothetical protein